MVKAAKLGLTETLIQEHLKMDYTTAKENFLVQVLFMKECLKTDCLKESGSLYKGNFHQGYKSGKGFETFADGSSYLGEYENDLFSGRGVLKYSDGAYYVGDFKDNNFNGEGVLTLSNGKKSREDLRMET